MNNDRITPEDLMLGDIIAFKNQYGKVTPPYEVEALEHNYVRALLLYRNDDTPSDEFFLDEKDSDEIVDVELSEEIIEDVFFRYNKNKLSLTETALFLSDEFVFMKQKVRYGICKIKEYFYIYMVEVEKCSLVKGTSKKIKTVREFQKELKNIERQK